MNRYGKIAWCNDEPIDFWITPPYVLLICSIRNSAVKSFNFVETFEREMRPVCSFLLDLSPLTWAQSSARQWLADRHTSACAAKLSFSGLGRARFLHASASEPSLKPTQWAIAHSPQCRRVSAETGGKSEKQSKSRGAAEGRQNGRISIMQPHCEKGRSVGPRFRRWRSVSSGLRCSFFSIPGAVRLRLRLDEPPPAIGYRPSGLKVPLANGSQILTQPLARLNYHLSTGIFNRV